MQARGNRRDGIDRIYKRPSEDAIAPDPYRQAGVDIDAGNALVAKIAPLARASARAGTTAALGGFGALFDPKAAGFKDPLLVATTDGVGTKLKVAIAIGKHDTIGIDLVAMSVNDLVVQGAEPLFFLDYFATSALDVEVAAAVVGGIAEGCRLCNCALVGGETAEMPGIYAPGDYDLAGFAVGAVERDRLLPRPDVTGGDVVIGLTSSGVHANGFSLVRRIVSEAGLAYTGPAPFAPETSLGEALLAPTRLYVRPALALARHRLVKAMAHITGGGLTENIPRVLPAGLGVALDAALWTRPPVFGWLAETGAIEPAAMARTFNCGIGFVLVVAAAERDEALASLAAVGEAPLVIGQVVEAGAERVTIANDGLLCRS